MVNFALEKLGLLILFPKRVIYLLKPTDNQRIVQVLRELVVLNVVGSNPTSHPEEFLDNQTIIEDFSFYTTFYYSRNRQKSLKIRLISTHLIMVCFPIVSLKTNRNILTIRVEVRKEEKRKDGTFKVRIRITQNRKIKRFLHTKISITLVFFI